jgi:capsular polysaccharide export protein
VPFPGPLADWQETLARLIADHAVTDIVLYGDTRPVHAEAARQAKAQGLRLHVFEEGYLRPYWISYERDGANGHSRLMDLTVPQMRAALGTPDAILPEAPARWGDMREHIFYGALYHFFVLVLNQRYRGYAPHRTLGVRAEFRLYLRRLLLMPWHRLERALATRAVLHGGFPYHLVLMQLEHDASFRDHSPFDRQTEFIDLCLEAFARGAPRHHHLVFKAHPLEDGRGHPALAIRDRALATGLSGRVHFVRGGKLARILHLARSAVTVNSTAGQQALWHGLPLKAFGTTVYAKPEFLSAQPLAEFFARPLPPDVAAYRDYRQFLLATSQRRGGYYSAFGRRLLLRDLVDAMLDPRDPYDRLLAPREAERQHLALVQ